MKYILKINGTDCLLTHAQLDAVIEIIDGAETHDERHVGADKGTQGYNNAYIPIIRARNVHDWLTIKPMSDELIETIKLRMKLDKEES